MGRAGRRARARGWPHGGEGSRGGGHGAVSTLRPPRSVRVKKKKKAKGKMHIAKCRRQNRLLQKAKNAEGEMQKCRTDLVKRKTQNAKCKMQKKPHQNQNQKAQKKVPRK